MTQFLNGTYLKDVVRPSMEPTRGAFNLYLEATDYKQPMPGSFSLPQPGLKTAEIFFLNEIYTVPDAPTDAAPWQVGYRRRDEASLFAMQSALKTISEMTPENAKKALSDLLFISQRAESTRKLFEKAIENYPAMAGAMAGRMALHQRIFEAHFENKKPVRTHPVLVNLVGGDEIGRDIVLKVLSEVTDRTSKFFTAAAAQSAGRILADISLLQDLMGSSALVAPSLKSIYAHLPEWVLPNFVQSPWQSTLLFTEASLLKTRIANHAVAKGFHGLIDWTGHNATASQRMHWEARAENEAVKTVLVGCFSDVQNATNAVFRRAVKSMTGAPPAGDFLYRLKAGAAAFPESAGVFDAHVALFRGDGNFFTSMEMQDPYFAAYAGLDHKAPTWKAVLDSVRVK